MTQQTSTPIWLQALACGNPDPLLPLPPVTPAKLVQLRKQDMTDTFEALFEQAIEAVENGEGISLFLSRDHRGVTPGKFMRWILTDPTRESRYKEACRVAAHLMRGDILAKADGTDQTIDDVARSKLAVDTRFKLMALADPKEFITTTRVDVTGHQSISLVGLMKNREQQGIAMVQRLNSLAPPDDVLPRALPNGSTDTPTPTPTAGDDDDDDLRGGA